MANSTDEIKIGDVVVQADETTVTFTTEGRDVNLRLSAEDLPDLISFFSSLKPSASEQRIGFRIPVAKMDTDTRHNLKMKASLADHSWDVTPIDFSLTGVLVESSELPDTGTQLDLWIEFCGKYTKIGANVVRHIGDNRLALNFPSSLRNGELDPPDSLIVIFRQIETLWLKQRINIE